MGMGGWLVISIPSDRLRYRMDRVVTGRGGYHKSAMDDSESDVAASVSRVLTKRCISLRGLACQLMIGAYGLASGSAHGPPDRGRAGQVRSRRS